MSVHQIHKTQMDNLDMLVKKFLKKWLKIQTNGVSDVAVYHPYMLNMKTPSQLYMEAHSGTYAMIRINGDVTVNHALNSRLERESQWSRKFSTISAVNSIFEKNINENVIVQPQTNDTNSTKIASIKAAKKAMKQIVQEETKVKWNTVEKKLTFQGDFLKLLIEEKSNVTWQSMCNNVPKGVLSFALKSCVNGLNSPDNIKRWGKRKNRLVYIV
jgi:hypothetical protein